MHSSYTRVKMLDNPRKSFSNLHDVIKFRRDLICRFEIIATWLKMPIHAPFCVFGDLIPDMGAVVR